MSKFCPFMSTNPSTFGASMTDGNHIPCMDTCALYVKGACSFKILAQKAISDFEKDKPKSTT